MRVLEGDQLTKVFGDPPTAVTAVQEATLAVEAGEVVLLHGPSGSGKTTLLSMLAGLLRPTSGEVRLEGVTLDVHDRSNPEWRLRSIGFVFQSFNLLPSLSAIDNIALPLRLAGTSRSIAASRAAQIVDALGLSKRARLSPRMLSGGEKQRVSIARALIAQPKVILADEPSASLDTHQGQVAMELLTSLARDGGHACLVVTHDQRLTRFADRVIEIEDGCLCQHA